jgi:hypothetical protein
MTTHGYRFNPYISVGFSIGVKQATLKDKKHYRYESEYVSGTTIAELFHFKARFRNGKISPYIVNELGYYLLLNGNGGVGFNEHFSIGISFGVVNLSVGYQWFPIKLIRNDYYSNPEDIDIGGLTFGISFGWGKTY